MTARVSPTQRVRAEIDELFASDGDLGDILEEVARLGARLLLQTALEAEVGEFLGRNRYERRQGAKAARAGSRNGYCPTTVKTTAGEVTLQRPKLRGTTEAFASRLLGAGVTRTNALESLVIAGFVRGLSVRDVEAALAEALGPGATVSKSTVSRVCEAIKDEFDAFKARDLACVELDYLFVDASHFKCTPAHRPSPCWWPGASTPPANPSSWASSPATPSPPTPGPGSCETCWPGPAPAGWSSPTAAPVSSPPWSWCSPTASVRDV